MRGSIPGYMASADSLFCSHVNAVGKVRVSGIFSPEGFDSAKSNPGGVEGRLY